MTARGASTSWIMLLTLAGVGTTLAFACATPFPALAAFAAAHLRRRDGVALALATWAAAQATGFCLLGYPRDPATLAWAPGLALAAVAGALAAHGAAARIGGSTLLRLAGALIAATLAFKGVVLLWSLGMTGHGGAAFSIEVLARQIARNAAVLAGLVALRGLLLAAGLPAPRRAAAA